MEKNTLNEIFNFGCMLLVCR